MTASDLIVGKPGGLTTCEALARGLVFVIANPIPGQEERNADHLLEHGSAIRSNNPATLSYKIEQLINDRSASPECVKTPRNSPAPTLPLTSPKNWPE